MNSKSSRLKNLLMTTGMSLVVQLLAGISGLILPVYIMKTFGSSVNGLVTSITQFLAVITFLDLGVGAVVQSSLYKPLAEKDKNQLSMIVLSAERFYRRIAILFLIYVACLTVVYPFIHIKTYSWIFTASLMLILAIGNFAQYYFGITYQTLLNADQKGYIPLALQAVAIVLNLIFCIILIKLGAPIHIVKLTTVSVYLIRPLGISWYAKKHYDIDRNIKIVGEPIKQKWNGLYKHIAAVVLNNTDVMVLTIFSTLSSVSVYTAYYNVIRMLKELMESLTNGIMPLLGNMYVTKDKQLLPFFEFMEWALHTIIVFIFSVTAVTIIPFIRVYTDGITDTNYIRPIFGVLLTIANMFCCMRIPYNSLVKAAGHYKETQNSAVIEVLINIIISVVAVFKYGLVGVAIGTMCAMLYRSVYLALYTSKYILNRGYLKFLNRIIIDAISIMAIYESGRMIEIVPTTYLEWIMLAMIVSLLSILIMAIINFLFAKKYIVYGVEYLKNKKSNF